MRRFAATFGCILALAAPVCADALRIEVGLGGVFPAGGWTHCRISGLEGVADGDLVIVHVSDMFERHFGVRDGAVEGLILMPDESPMISVEVPGRGRVALPPEATRRLRGVKDKLPVIFLGENPPDEAELIKALEVKKIFPIRMSAAELADRPVRDFEWVHVFVLGKMSESEVTQLRKHFSHFSDSVVVAKPDDLTGWIEKLAFKKVGELSAYSAELAEFLPIPRGSVRGEFYDIFGPPKWPRRVRRDVALMFVAVLLVFAISVVFPGKTRGKRAYRLVYPVLSALVLTFMASWRISNPAESVSLFEGRQPDGGGSARKGVETKVISKAVLERGGRGAQVRDLLAVPQRVTPVASHPRQWVEHRLVLTRMGELERGTPLGFRDVSVRHWYGRIPGRLIFNLLMGGDYVCVVEVPPRRRLPFERPSSRQTIRPFSEYLAERHHPDARVEELRDGMLRYWYSHRRQKGIAYNVAWTEASTEGEVFDAGVMVVIKAGHCVERWKPPR